MDESFIQASHYVEVYIVVLGIISLICYSRLSYFTADDLAEQSVFPKNVAFVLALIVIAYIGYRPLSGVFTDMYGYASYYINGLVVDTGELGLYITILLGHQLGLSLEGWFTLIAAIFFLSYFFASYNFSQEHGGVIFLTILVAFLTFAYATNVIRSGMAHALLFLGISSHLKNEDKKVRVIALLCFAAAFLAHKTTALPLACFFVSLYLKNVSLCFKIWVLSIFLSLALGNQATALFQNLGFDDRLDNYLTSDNFEGFSRTGFRWDFLLYSSMPILLGYYITFMRRVSDPIYTILLSTYLLSNSFWVIVIRASFSDRFAYLSWFLYPIVLAYPLLKMDIWDYRQGVNAKLILIGHLAFTMFMTFFY